MEKLGSLLTTRLMAYPRGKHGQEERQVSLSFSLSLCISLNYNYMTNQTLATYNHLNSSRQNPDTIYSLLPLYALANPN
jgi:hypothetical protein